MTNLFEYTDYRSFLIALVDDFKARNGTKAQLAHAMNCQAAYFSQVLGYKVHLTEDQGLKLCRFLEFDPLETEYFLLILRHARAGSVVLQEYLDERRQRLLETKNELDARLSSRQAHARIELSAYYCTSWIPSAIHIATSCSSYQTIPALSQKLKLNQDTVGEHLSILEKHSLVKNRQGRWIFQGDSLHFSKNSQFDKALQNSRRFMAMNSLAARKPADVHYSSVFAVDKTTAKKLRELMIKTIETLHKNAEPAPSEEVYSVCLDYFQL